MPDNTFDILSKIVHTVAVRNSQFKRPIRADVFAGRRRRGRDGPRSQFGQQQDPGK
jgi:hypothetical protein